MWHIYTMKYYIAVEEGDHATCDNMDGPSRYYAKCSKSDWERQIQYGFTHMWTLKTKTNE